MADSKATDAKTTGSKATDAKLPDDGKPPEDRPELAKDAQAGTPGSVVEGAGRDRVPGGADPADPAKVRASTAIPVHPVTGEPTVSEDPGPVGAPTGPTGPPDPDGDPGINANVVWPAPFRDEGVADERGLGVKDGPKSSGKSSGK